MELNYSTFGLLLVITNLHHIGCKILENFQIQQNSIIRIGTSKQIGTPTVASELTLAAQEHPYATFICQTWVFPFSTFVKNDEDEFLQEELFSDSYTALNFDNLVPIVVTHILENHQKNSNLFYSKEFQMEDIISSSRFGFRQKTANCVSLFIEVNDLKNAISTTLELINLKYGRQHKDFFIFIGRLSLIEKVYGGNIQIQDIRYRYALEEQIIQNEQLNQIHKNWNSGSLVIISERLFHFWNFCRRPNENFGLLFERHCDTHINRRHFVVVASSIRPFVHFELDEVKDRLNPAGILYLLFLETSRRRNFTFDIGYSGYLGSSGFKQNGTWFGAVGEVFKREADIAFGVATTVHRFPINDPGVTQVWITRYFYIRSPPFQATWESLFWPLTIRIWLLTLCTVIFLVIPVYYACVHFYFNSLVETKSGDIILVELVDALYRILLEQSATVRHWKGTRIRLMVVLWTFFCLVIGTGYRSKLINFLTFIGQSEVPMTHYDLSLSHYKLFFRWMGGVAFKYTANSPDPMHKRIMKRAIMVNTSSDGLFQALFQEKSAWLDYSINAEFALQRYATLNPSMKENPLFVKSKDSDYTCHIVWSFRKASPWVESFDWILLNLLSAGLYDYYEGVDGYETRVRGAKWLRTHTDTRIREKMEQIIETLSVGPKPLNNGALLGLFFILFLGLCAGTLSWISENIVTYSKRCLKNKKKLKKLVTSTRKTNTTSRMFPKSIKPIIVIESVL